MGSHLFTLACVLLVAFGERSQVAGVQGFLFVIVLGIGGSGSSAVWMVGYGTAPRPHACPGSDPLSSLKCVGFVSSLSGKDK